ncbi:hypothetical protein [Pseudonocardia spinosispora]|nr:hypothetical protein [Pseudonocardia spinosispora]
MSETGAGNRFGQFVCSWAPECVIYNPDGSQALVMSGALRFG